MQPTTTPAAVPSTAPQPREQPAQVSLTDGLLEVRADNTSLNQILRSVSRLTGLAIVGGVADQPVFGNYGPAQPSQVLATLLDGTGVNMLYKAGDATHAPELVLTQRNGGASPPSPSPVAESYRPPMTAQPQTAPEQPQDEPAAGYTNNLNQPGQPVQQQDAQPTQTPASTPGASSGVLTPEQVYQQLMKMQRGNQSTPTTTTPPSDQ